MRLLTDIEYDILNALYFVEPFEKILEETHATEPIVADALKFLIDHKLVSPMKWNDNAGDFERTYFYDTDNMHAYHYLATREGLQAHNSRS